MLAANLKIVQAGNDTFSSDINQYGDGLSAKADLGALSLLEELTAPGTPTLTATGSGNLSGTYHYIVVFASGWVSAAGNFYVNGFVPGTAASVSTTSQEVQLTSIPTGPTGTIARVIYRTAGGGAAGTEEFAAWIGDNSTTALLDNVADGSLGTGMPTVNGTAIPADVPTTNTTGTSLTGILNLSSGSSVTGTISGAATWSGEQTFSAGITGTGTVGSLTVPWANLTSVPSLVNTFNGRSGTVVPASGDYSFSDISGTLGNSGLVGPLVDSLTATNGLSVSNPTGVGAASYSLVLNGSTLSLGSSGLSLNLGEANTWTGSQTFDAGIVVPSGESITGGGALDLTGAGTFGGLLTASGGLTGTGSTGTLTAGTGILGTANTWTATQTFSSGASFTGTGSTGTLTAGTGILGTANSWTAGQTFGAGGTVASGETLAMTGATVSGAPTFSNGLTSAGAITLANGVPLYGNDTSSTQKTIAYVDTSNGFRFGDNSNTYGTILQGVTVTTAKGGNTLDDGNGGSLWTGNAAFNGVLGLVPTVTTANTTSPYLEATFYDASATKQTFAWIAGDAANAGGQDTLSLWSGMASGQTNKSVFGIDLNGNVTANTFFSTVPTGTAPLAVDSITEVTNLNAQFANLRASDSGALGALASGSYTGTAATLAVTTTFAPKMVVITGPYGGGTSIGTTFLISGQSSAVSVAPSNSTGSQLVYDTTDSITATGFSLSASSVYNSSGSTYHYVAIG